MLASVQEAVYESWTDALGVSPQPADNFFEEGGDSLSAVELVAAIDGRLGRAPALEDLYRWPTPTALVGLLIADTASVPAEHHTIGRTVVPLRRAGRDRVWCFLPPLSGAVTRYASMARLLPLSDAVWACETPAELSAQGLDRLGSGLAAAVRERGLDGFDEIVLVGYSLGATIALEVARAMIDEHATGADFAARLQLILLDPLPPGTSMTSVDEAYELFVRNGWRIDRPAADFVAADGSRDLAAVAVAAAEAGTLPAGTPPDQVAESWAVYEANTRLLDRYAPQPLPLEVPTTLLVCSAAGADPALAGPRSVPVPPVWSHLVPPDRAWALDVDHFALLERPTDEIVGQWLTSVAGPAGRPT
jgi:thioesterase domain-containing protein/acyl carrier protein